jgi:hypothetical protein
MIKSKKPIKVRNYVYILLTTMILLFLVINNYTYFKYYRDISSESNKDAISLRLNSLHVDLNNFPRTSVNDIAFLSEMTSTKNLFNGSTNLEETDILEFMKQNSAYYQAILLDLQGNEILKIENINQNYTTNYSAKENFTSKDFWKEIQELYNGKVIVSDIKIEENKETKIPILTYATSVLDGEEKMGYLILKTNAGYFLDNIRYAKREGEEVFLVRENGEYIANANSTKEFSFDKGISVYSDYPELREKQIVENQVDFIESENYLFSFKYITISKGYFTEYSGEEDNLWILVSVTDKSELNIPTFSNFIIHELPVLTILIILLMLIIHQKSRK